MFDKILIANRGEIACRIIKTAQKLGIKTVSIYSEADTNSLHVTMADEAVFVGPSPASESYLSIPKLMDAIQKTGAQAVHPGYGFLSENKVFVDKLEKEGVKFIGPSSKAVHKMGDKIEAKKIALKAGVNTIPGYMGIIKDHTEAKKIATEIGFPVMIKAAAGGGGKGMRVVHSADEVQQAFESATNEAKNSFSDDRIFIEKFIEKPRHIEIQVLADKFGNVLCVGERECSIQRHHQKVIEEAPSPFIDNKTRQKMYDQCKALAKEVGYYSAGTVEFIVDANRNFYFLEMNTRLQVEHPVTELISGLDLVEEMFRVASGEKLRHTQDDIKLNGWAIESRIYAEDPSRGFLPSVGRITEYKRPEESQNIRIDSGVYEGGEVSMFYDAMIAKLCTYGQTREEAIEHMQNALGEYVIRGISHNISFLEAVMSNSKFRAGDITTNFIEDEYPDGFSGAELTSDLNRVLLSVATHIYLKDAERAGSINGQLKGRKRLIGNRWVVSIDDQDFSIYTRHREDGYDIKHDSEDITIRSSWKPGNSLFKGNINGKLISVHIDYFPGGFYLTHAGTKVKTKVRTPIIAELDKFMPKIDSSQNDNELIAPISGRIVSIKVEEGEEVKSGQDLVIIDAMKMENIICADKDAKIKKIYYKAEDSIMVDEVIIEFE